MCCFSEEGFVIAYDKDDAIYDLGADGKDVVVHQEDTIVNMKYMIRYWGMLTGLILL